jgi:hypothetical protein
MDDIRNAELTATQQRGHETIGFYDAGTGGGNTGTEQGTSSPLIWRLFVWGVAFVVALHYGLFHAMLTSASGFVEIGAVVCGALFFLSSLGRSLFKVAIGLVILGAAAITLLGFLCQYLASQHTSLPANTKHYTIHQTR